MHPTLRTPFDRLEDRRRQLLAQREAWLESVPADQLRRPVIRHPVCGHLDAATGLGFLESHFDHHLRQIRRIRSSPDFPQG